MQQDYTQVSLYIKVEFLHFSNLVPGTYVHILDFVNRQYSLRNLERLRWYSCGT